MRHCSTLFFGLAAAVALGCSESAPAASSAVFDAGASADGGTGADAKVGDSVAVDQCAADQCNSGAADTEATDNASSGVDAPDPVADSADAAPPLDIDFDLLDPQDAATADLVEPKGPVGQLYAHTAEELYKLDVAAKAFVLTGKWSYDKNAGSVTDIALDGYGQLFAITHKDLFQCNVDTAKCKWLAAMPEQYYGMTLVPKGTVDPNKDAMIGVSQDGDWVQIVVTGGVVKLQKLGNFGSGWLCSGDAFSVGGVGTFATVKKATGGNDSLASIDPKTGKVLKIIGDTGVKSLFGLAWWDNVVYGFSSDGNVYELDITTGKATPIGGISAPKGLKWWGAGVSTRAAGQ